MRQLTSSWQSRCSRSPALHPFKDSPWLFVRVCVDDHQQPLLATQQQAPGATFPAHISLDSARCSEVLESFPWHWQPPDRQCTSPPSKGRASSRARMSAALRSSAAMNLAARRWNAAAAAAVSARTSASTAAMASLTLLLASCAPGTRPYQHIMRSVLGKQPMGSTHGSIWLPPLCAPVPRQWLAFEN